MHTYKHTVVYLFFLPTNINKERESIFSDKKETFDKKNKYRIWISFLIGFIYACNDEIYQSFIPGRAAMIGDIIIDTLGTLSGVLIISILLYIKYRKTAK